MVLTIASPLGDLLKDRLALCSADILADLGLKWVILGHSERRALIKESSEVQQILISKQGLKQAAKNCLSSLYVQGAMCKAHVRAMHNNDNRIVCLQCDRLQAHHMQVIGI